MSKSQSTPERLTQRSPKKINSVGNLNDKVKLQVVYKPPFKFSLKLSKQNGSVKTQVLGGSSSKNKRKSRNIVDKKRLTAAISSVTPKDDSSQRVRGRTALLIKTEEPMLEVSEPNYETLNPKKEAPVYENLNINGESAANQNSINTATFRVKKSASGSNLVSSNNLNSKTHVGSSSNNTNSYKLSSRGSSTNLNQMAGNSNRRNSITNSNTNLSKNFGGSSQNLIRSSTTNLSKQKRNSLDMKRDSSRSSTTNLTKIKNNRHPHGSNINLRYDAFDGTNFLNDEHQSRSRKNSTNIPRVSSNTNLKNSLSNIPRASLTNQINLVRQTSLQSNNKSVNIQSRPHTSGCDDKKNFEWPKNYNLTNRHLNDEPLPSDLEVMVSDVENLVNE